MDILKNAMLCIVCLLVSGVVMGQQRRFSSGEKDNYRRIRNRYRKMVAREVQNVATARLKSDPARDKANSLYITNSPLRQVQHDLARFVTVTSRDYFHSKYPITPTNPRLNQLYNTNLLQNILTRRSYRNLRNRERDFLGDALDIRDPRRPHNVTHMAEGERVLLVLYGLKRVMKETLEYE